MPPRRPDRSCSVKTCNADFYADDLCKRHYYRKKRTGDPLTFRIARLDDRFDEHGNRWCSGHKRYLDPAMFGAKSRCRICRRLEKYKLTLSQFEALGLDVSDTCPICHKRTADVIDHNHDSGNVRGLLCRQCNIAIGTMTEQGVRRAAEYLARHNHNQEGTAQ